MDLLNSYADADTISIDTLALEESILEERTKEIAELNKLSKKVYFLHTSLLYYRNPKTKMGSYCYEAWQTLIKRVGGAPKTWKELGYRLGIPKDDLDYIENSIKDDPTDVVLKVFRENDNATLDKVLDAFVQMKRYDILKSLEKPLSQLANCFYKEDSKSDTGYHSSSKGGSRRPVVNLKNIPNDLPPALSSKYNLTMEGRPPNEPAHTEQVPSKSTDTETDNDSLVLYLTYTEDGINTALDIQNRVKNWTGDLSDVTVITLEDRKFDVLQNPELRIREYFQKADFVVPIVTEGYLKAIKAHSRVIPCTRDNLDVKYAGFVYALIINYFLYATGCLNMKVRSVIPDNVPVKIYSDIAFYPDLIPWTNEDTFDETFQAYLQKVLKDRKKY